MPCNCTIRYWFRGRLSPFRFQLFSSDRKQHRHRDAAAGDRGIARGICRSPCGLRHRLAMAWILAVATPAQNRSACIPVKPLASHHDCGLPSAARSKHHRSESYQTMQTLPRANVPNCEFCSQSGTARWPTCAAHRASSDLDTFWNTSEPICLPLLVIANMPQLVHFWTFMLQYEGQ